MNCNPNVPHGSDFQSLLNYRLQLARKESGLLDRERVALMIGVQDNTLYKHAAGHVTFFCTHREDTATVVFPGVGIVKAFNPGCLSQMQPIWKHSDPTSWSQGYGIDFIAKSGSFLRVHVPIWRGESLAGAMVEKFRS